MDRNRAIGRTRAVANRLHAARAHLRRMLRAVTEAEFKTGAAVDLAQGTAQALDQNIARGEDRFLATLRELRPEAVAWAADALAAAEEELEAIRGIFAEVLAELEEQLAGEEAQG